MVDVDAMFAEMASVLREKGASRLAADEVMPLVRRALEVAWSEGFGRGMADWAAPGLAGNPYTAEDWRDWV